MSELLLEARGICKTYGEVRANDNIHFAVEAGSKHALIGENGAGKSTLVNILHGTVEADEGEIFWRGERVQVGSPQAAKRLGIGIIFQHFALFDSLTVAENIRLGVDGRAARQQAGDAAIRALSEKYALAIEPKRVVGDLSVGEKQRVEILRSLLRSPRLLILDEPTSVLTPAETDALFRLLNQLAEEGCGIIFISHKLHEVESLCTSATILRNGKTVYECLLAETPRETLISRMVGEVAVAPKSPPKTDSAKPLLTVAGVNEVLDETLSLRVDSLELKQGRIVGVAGIAGNGQDSLLNLLSGELTTAAANIRYGESDIGDWPVLRRMKAGILSVPTERHNHATVNSLSLLLNTLIGEGNPPAAHQFINFAEARKKAEQIIDHFDVATPGTGEAAASLSGGNLQKFIIGRALLQHPAVLLLANPSWGVDVRAAAFIHEQIVRLAEAGNAVLVISEDLDELFYLSDEMAVINRGTLFPARRVDAIDRNAVGAQMAAADS